MSKGSRREREAVESLPDSDLPIDTVESLTESERIEVAEPVMVYFNGDVEFTSDIVLSTQTHTRLLSHYTGSGWIVEFEWAHKPDESPEHSAMMMLSMASEKLSEGLPDHV